MKISENPYKKSIILALFLFGPLLIMIIAGFVSRHQAGMALREAEQEVFIEWFEADEIAHQYALIWEEGGLLELEILDQAQVDVVLGSDEFSGFGQAARNDIETLLTGCFPIIADSGFNAERFLRAISRIDRILGVDIQRQWDDLIQGN